MGNPLLRDHTGVHEFAPNVHGAIRDYIHYAVFQQLAHGRELVTGIVCALMAVAVLVVGLVEGFSILPRIPAIAVTLMVFFLLLAGRAFLSFAWFHGNARIITNVRNNLWVQTGAGVDRKEFDALLKKIDQRMHDRGRHALQHRGSLNDPGDFDSAWAEAVADHNAKCSRPWWA